MAGSEINLYGVGDVDLTALMDTVDKQRVTYQGLSLTNVDNDNLPAIAAGSLIEVAGALFKFTGEEAITGWSGISNDTDAYIKIVPAGTSPDTVTAVFTETAPVWSDAKQGYYGTGGSADHRYIGGLKRGTAAADYWEKYLIKWKPGELATKIVRIEDWDMDADAAISINHDLADITKTRHISAIIRRDDDTSFSSILIDGRVYIVTTEIFLTRENAGFFDNVNYDDTSFNRGWVKIEYEA